MSAPSPSVARAESVLRDHDVEEQVVLFHSGDASLDVELSNGIEPTFGPWLQEVMSSAVDDDQVDEIRKQDPVAFYAEKPGWVAVKASRAAGKFVHEMTVEDLERHGQLCIVLVERNDRSVWRAGKEGTAEQFCGQGRYTMTDLPFGVEPGDIFTTDAFIPEITLTGCDLVDFLARNFPHANVLGEPLPEPSNDSRGLKP